jgi:hypothetical protein
MSRKSRNRALVGPYAERMAWIPVLGSPKYITKDDEFVWYEMEVPTAYRNLSDEFMTYGDKYDAELDAHIAAVDWLPVHCGLEVLSEDETITVFKVPVPIKFLESDYGILYYQKRQMNKYADYKLQEGE